jgi:hypothetical protein
MKEKPPLSVEKPASACSMIPAAARRSSAMKNIVPDFSFFMISMRGEISFFCFFPPARPDKDKRTSAVESEPNVCGGVPDHPAAPEVNAQFFRGPDSHAGGGFPAQAPREAFFNGAVGTVVEGVYPGSFTAEQFTDTAVDFGEDRFRETAPGDASLVCDHHEQKSHGAQLYESFRGTGQQSHRRGVGRGKGIFSMSVPSRSRKPARVHYWTVLSPMSLRAPMYPPRLSMRGRMPDRRV